MCDGTRKSIARHVQSVYVAVSRSCVVVYRTCNPTTRVQSLGCSTDNQAGHPAGVDKMAAFSRRGVVALEDCEGKAYGRKMAGVSILCCTA